MQGNFNLEERPGLDVNAQNEAVIGRYSRPDFPLLAAIGASSAIAVALACVKQYAIHSHASLYWHRQYQQLHRNGLA